MNTIMLVGTGESTPEIIYSSQDSENSLTTELQLLYEEPSFLQDCSDTQNFAGKIRNPLLQIKYALNLYRRHFSCIYFFFVSESDFSLADQFYKLHNHRVIARYLL